MTDSSFSEAVVGKTNHAWIIDPGKWHVRVDYFGEYSQFYYFWTKRGAIRFATWLNTYFSEEN